MTFTLYSLPHSRSLRVAWALQEVGADFRCLKVSMAPRSPALLDVNPSGKVPVLIAQDLVLTEANAMLEYIADLHPEAGLLPPVATPERAKVLQWCAFSSTELEQPLWAKSCHKFIFPPERRVPEVMDTLAWHFGKQLDVLSQGLGDKDTLMGEQFTIADILVTHTLYWAQVAKMDLKHDNVKAYLARHSQRPALKAAIACEEAASLLDDETA